MPLDDRQGRFKRLLTRPRQNRGELHDVASKIEAAIADDTDTAAEALETSNEQKQDSEDGPAAANTEEELSSVSAYLGDSSAAQPVHVDITRLLTATPHSPVLAPSPVTVLDDAPVCATANVLARAAMPISAHVHPWVAPMLAAALRNIEWATKHTKVDRSRAKNVSVAVHAAAAVVRQLELHDQVDADTDRLLRVTRQIAAALTIDDDADARSQLSAAAKNLL